MNRPAPRSVSPTRPARSLAALLAVAVLAMAACTAGGASPSVEPGASAAPLEGTAWQLTDYVGPDGKTLPVPAAVAATANFSAGKIAGNAGCNQYNGTYSVDGAKMTIGTVAMTAMACPEVQMAVEQAYVAALAKVATYSISGTTLEMKTAEGTLGLRYAATEAGTLTGTGWIATGINNGKGAVESVVATSTVTAVFAEDGTLAGNGGCNQYNGPYTVDGTAIDIGPLASTKMACADEAISRQETSYLAALDKVTTYTISGESLQLRDADGALQAEYRATP